VIFLVFYAAFFSEPRALHYFILVKLCFISYTLAFAGHFMCTSTSLVVLLAVIFLCVDSPILGTNSLSSADYHSAINKQASKQANKQTNKQSITYLLVYIKSGQ